MAVDDRFVQEVKEKNDIAEVIGSYIPVIRKGRSCKALCPFHSEKTPSFNINENMQIYKCFGCGKGGDVIQFVQEMEGVEFIDALKILASRVAMPWPEEDFSPREAAQRRYKEELYEIHVKAARIFFAALRDPVVGREPLDYLLKRGLSQEVMRRFGVGYASFENKILENLGGQYPKKILLESGLLVEQKDGSLKDRFKHRIMFPIFSSRGKVIAFGGRALKDGYGPKYLNSPETPIFSKKEELYAFHLAKQEIRQKGALLVEGYMDVITLFQYGFQNAVASLGTSMTKEQALMLKRYDHPVTIVYDSDEAGTLATERALSILEKEGVQTRIVHLKDAKDPDEFLRLRGEKGFESVLRNAMTGLKFRLFLIRRALDLKNSNDRQLYIQESARLLKEFEAENKAGYSQVEESVVAIAKETGISIRAMGQEVYGKYFSMHQFSGYEKGAEGELTGQGDYSLTVADNWKEREEALLQQLRSHPSMRRYATEEDFLLEEHKKIFEELNKNHEDLSIDLNTMVKGEKDRVIIEEKELLTVIKQVRRYTIEKLIEELEEKQKLMRNQYDKEVEMMRLGQEIIQLRNKIK